MDETDQEEKQCSNCKRFISAQTIVLHEVHCRRHIKLCDVCNEPVPIHEMEEHCQENHAPTSCDRCGANMARDQLEEHMESQCPERSVECKYCELEVKAGDYDTHIDTCGSRTDFCDKCNIRVMLKDMEEHKLAKCGDLKADDFHIEPTLENLPPSYMDGFTGGNFTPATTQGGLVGARGDSHQALLAAQFLGFGGAPDYLEGGAIFFGGRQTDDPRERRELDRQWLEEVGNVCEGEDLDQMMAQAIAMEDKQQATAHDHMFGSEDRILQEGHYATTFKDIEAKRAEKDAEMARQLQNTFDHEYLHQVDRNPTRQLEDEEKTVSSPPINPHLQLPPPAYGEQIALPFNAHLSRPLLTSDHSPSDYTLEQAQFKDHAEGGKGKEKQEAEMERELMRQIEREKQRQEQDSLLAKRLQMEERDRFKNEVARKMEEARGSSGKSVEIEDDSEEDDEALNDEKLALELLKKEIRKAEIELEERKKKVRETERKFELSRKKLEDTQAEVEEPKRKQKLLVEGSSLAGAPTQHQGIHHERDWDMKLHARHDYQPRPLHKLHPTHSPLPTSPPRTPPGEPSTFNNIPALEPYGDNDSEQPRCKPIPKPHPPDDEEDNIPCQFCKESFPFDMIMEHQRHCTADYGVGGMGREGMRGRMGERRPPVQVNVDELLREEQTKERERTGGGNVVCKYCNEIFPQAVIDPHQVLCDNNPDKGLKNAYKSHLSGQTLNKNLSPVSTVATSQHSALLPSLVQHTSSQPHPTPLPPISRPPLSSTQHQILDGLPCEYCQTSFPPDNLLSHQAMCPQRPHSMRKTHLNRRDQAAVVGGGEGDMTDVVPCQFCDQLIPFKECIKHETVCRYQPFPSTTVTTVTPKPLTLPTLGAATTQAATLPNKPIGRPTQQRGMAAVFLNQAPPTNQPNTTHNTQSTSASTMTDDQKTDLKSSSATTNTTTAFRAQNVHGHESLKMHQLFSSTGVGQPHMPQIYMYSSASQPHALGSVQPHALNSGVTGKDVKKEPSVLAAPKVKMQQQPRSVEVIRDQQHSRQNNPSTATTNDQYVQRHSLGHQTSASTFIPPSGTVSLPSCNLPTPITAAHINSSHSTPPRLIGTDGTIVRPTHSDFTSIQRQHQAMIPTPIPMQSDLMSNPLKMAVSTPSVVGNITTIPPISTTLSSKDGKTTQEDKTFYNVQLNTQNTLLEKGGMKMMTDTLIQKPMGSLDMQVLPIQTQNTTTTLYKDSTSLKEMKTPLKTKQSKISELSKGKGKGVLDTIKINPGNSTTNLSLEIMGIKSYSSQPSSRSYKDHNTTQSPASSTDNPPQFPVPTSRDISPSTGSTDNPSRYPRQTSSSDSSDKRGPPFSTSGSYSLSGEEGGSSGICDSRSESSATLTSITGPLVEYTNSYSDYQSTMSALDHNGDDEGGEAMPELEVVPETQFYPTAPPRPELNSGQNLGQSSAVPVTAFRVVPPSNKSSSSTMNYASLLTSQFSRSDKERKLTSSQTQKSCSKKRSSTQSAVHSPSQQSRASPGSVSVSITGKQVNGKHQLRPNNYGETNRQSQPRVPGKHNSSITKPGAKLPRLTEHHPSNVRGGSSVNSNFLQNNRRANSTNAPSRPPPTTNQQGVSRGSRK